MNKKHLELFDFDGTLTRKDTFVDLIKFQFGIAKLLLGFGMYLPHLFLMKVKLYSNAKTKQKIFKHFFKGMDIQTFNKLCKSYCDSRFMKIMRPSAMTYLEQSEAEKVIVSASIQNWVKCFAERLNIETILATEIEIDEYGKLTGNFSSNNCHGDEKVLRIKNLINDRSSYQITAFGDTSGDKAMINYADKGHYNYFK
ncbi:MULTISPECIES: HAD-IB family hydrolase [Sphingobacterium]|uniref:HAD-IB family hydrolase n=1 Tax=Sphingobacterium hotanense TaxID=649196 RepID=A0ABT7NJ99_9SPHI|nr:MULTISPECIES: HAD-IB family hydrolase [Sphingobacterium]MDM1047269.1 HAD-IB family hydrolase [Sphingobacterium hotanense]